MRQCAANMTKSLKLVQYIPTTESVHLQLYLQRAAFYLNKRISLQSIGSATAFVVYFYFRLVLGSREHLFSALSGELYENSNPGHYQQSHPDKRHDGLTSLRREV